MTALPADFLGPPLAHRAFHDVTAGRPENSRAAIRAAIAAGYGIEIDVQMSADGVAMVFHDYLLTRLTGREGAVRHFTADALAATRLIGGDEGIPTLAEVLALVAGRVPLLIEIKDQDGAMGPDVGPLERAVADALADYRGPLAVMSFNPHSVAAFGQAAPDVPRGLTSSAFLPEDWPNLNERVLAPLRGMPDLERVGASFISHDAHDLANPRVAEVKAAGLPVLCWTIRSPEAETQAREIADNVTFEGYAAALPA
ncbi:glycerophosphodiester phosphodiesterase family protein [Maritimibacter fusiformis]|uniref:Phosphodiesterase n=1 Tax=Maritimibacter fusiformis TaxID=2603819 RepID=A0A5D0RLK9_9RHOB|nr:glycerophosphodiester phosphodiesterase family protein [Maritimibacter fusiformis]TYB82009.1 phosphodiesterase [Maritimibacter fusiformis]